jgi:hypothetical protein
MSNVQINNDLLIDILNKAEVYTEPDLVQTEINNAVSEFLIKKDNVFTNVLSDYMINNEHGQESTIKNVYDKLNQSNQNKLRHIDIINYDDKLNKEYLNIILIIIFVCIIIIPIAIANKNSLLPNNVTLILLVTLLFLASVYIFYKVVDIYMRDNMDFDKIRIPYDRTATQLEKSGLLTRKKNPLTSLTLTCVGQDCCDGSMVYDYAKNKCLMTENFNNYFENYQNKNNNNNNNNNKTSGIEAFGTCSKDFLIRKSLNFSNDILFNIPLDAPTVTF